jgi:2-polyprenyl-3-methyl-5-hydroxy-6-metoxy-1,4-benzoquinol methylase
MSSNIDEINTKLDFCTSEIKRIYAMLRNMQLDNSKPYEDFSITYDAFNNQWGEVEIPDLQNHINICTDNILNWTGHSQSWFKNKTVLDAGCGIGRFSYGFLKYGADLKSIDFSSNGIELTKKNCAIYNHTEVHKVNLLTYDDKEQFDLVWSYGVCHHTGNTKLALLNLFSKVKSGGEIFLMLYGFPKNNDEFKEVLNYQNLRDELILIPKEKKIDFLKKRLIELFPKNKGNQSSEEYYKSDKGKMFLHGWHDAVAPSINELLTYEEIFVILSNNGFHNIRRVTKNRNIHVMADKY